MRMRYSVRNVSSNLVDCRLPLRTSFGALCKKLNSETVTSYCVTMSEIAIPLDVAVKCCKQYREEHKVRMFSQCWGCVRFSKDNPEKMCFYKPPNHNGCEKVNAYAKKLKK